MLKWLKQAIGGKNEVLTPELEAWAKNLQTLLGSLENAKDIPTNFADNLGNYVLHGEPVSVLHEISKIPSLAAYVGQTQRSAQPGRAEFYRAFKHVPVNIALRWARVLETVMASLSSNSAQYALPFPDAAHWPEVLMMNAAGRDLYGWQSRPPKVQDLHADQMEALLVEAGLPPETLLAASFGPQINSSYRVADRSNLVTQLEGYADYLHRHIDTVRPLFVSASVDRSVAMLGFLGGAHDKTLESLANELAELGTSSSKQIRAAAESLIRRASSAMVEPLKRQSLESKPEQRSLALRLLWDIAEGNGSQELMEFARTTATADKAQSVRILLQEWEHRSELASRESRGYDYTLPVIDWSARPTAAVDAALSAFWEEANRAIEKSNKSQREHHEAMKAKGHNWALRQNDLLTKTDLNNLRAHLNNAQSPQDRSPNAMKSVPAYLLQSAWLTLAATEGMTSVVLARICEFLYKVKAHYNGISYQAVQGFNALHEKSGAPTLLELAQIAEGFDASATDVLHSYCDNSSLAATWDAASSWPFFAHHCSLLNSGLVDKSVASYNFNRQRLFKAISLLPWPHEETVNVLFDLALGTAKTERVDAQNALNNHPGKEVRIIAALGNGKAEVRTIAAKWLHDIGYHEAIPDLETAVAKEKNDVAKGAMLDALQRFGQPVEKYLDRDALKKEATKTLAKGLPKDIEWFPWNAMPAVRWADNGETVADEVLRLLLAQSVKQKSPEPNAVLRKFCGMFEERDCERFGQFVLEAWIREDTNPIPSEEAERRAHTQAVQMHSWIQSSPQYFQGSPHLGKSVDELYAFYLPGQLRQPAGTAIASKGVLAMAAACAAEHAATPVARYLKDYYGTRAAHGKALIAMLAWIEHPSATQLMLSVGNRFRTKSFQEEATRQAEALAERKGWSLAELADRTIPTGGFDATGTLELSYGDRSFAAKLLPDFKIELYNPDGKKVAALSEPRADDDAEQAKASKQALSSAKKEIKNIVTLQTERLYEALCTERDWLFADWEAYLNQHAIVRRLIQRLVWVQVEDGRVLQAFRPLDDGTLTDVDDNEVKLPGDARVRLAHDSVLPSEDVAAWQTHLADYEVVPLFQQLGKGSYVLPEESSKQDTIKDFEGHLLETFALRGRATKLGYTRGGTEDGGWFFTYEKRFPTLGIVAVIEFTGNGLPEENRTVALLALGFRSADDKGWQRHGMKLGNVPKVLLSECYNDLRLIAADGTGFDAEWEKKSSF